MALGFRVRTLLQSNLVARRNIAESGGSGEGPVVHVREFHPYP